LSLSKIIRNKLFKVNQTGVGKGEIMLSPNKKAPIMGLGGIKRSKFFFLWVQETGVSLPESVLGRKN